MREWLLTMVRNVPEAEGDDHVSGLCFTEETDVGVVSP